MRIVLLALSCLLVSGCTDPTAAFVESSAGSECSPDRKGVVVYNEDFFVATGMPFEAPIEIPECARQIQLELSATQILQPTVLEVRLSGCGSTTAYDSPSGNLLVVVTLGDRHEAELCETATAGLQTLAIEAELGQVQGRALVRMDLQSA